MRFIRSVVLLAVLVAWRIGCAQVVLVTEQEAQASSAVAPPLFTPKAAPVPGAPKIVLQMPDISQPVASPIRIRLEFKPTPPAVIRPETFRVLYGMFKLDITSRITGATTVTPAGLDVAEALLPPGRHSILVELKDSIDRLARQSFQFVIE